MSSIKENKNNLLNHLLNRGFYNENNHEWKLEFSSDAVKQFVDAYDDLNLLSDAMEFSNIHPEFYEKGSVDQMECDIEQLDEELKYLMNGWKPDYETKLEDEVNVLREYLNSQSEIKEYDSDLTENNDNGMDF